MLLTSLNKLIYLFYLRAASLHMFVYSRAYVCMYSRCGFFTVNRPNVTTPIVFSILKREVVRATTAISRVTADSHPSLNVLTLTRKKSLIRERRKHGRDDDEHPFALTSRVFLDLFFPLSVCKRRLRPRLGKQTISPQFQRYTYDTAQI